MEGTQGAEAMQGSKLTVLGLQARSLQARNAERPQRRERETAMGFPAGGGRQPQPPTDGMVDEEAKP